MHSFVRKLITEWRRLEMPFKGETILVAVSGGADSVALLLAIDDLRKQKKLDLRIVAAHFDHKLRGDDSASDLDFVRGLTVERSIELAHGEWKRRANGNLEQEARQARYNFLLRTAENVHARHLLTGHTMNDQAETVLMNLIRGSGVEGLGGMQPIRVLEAADVKSGSAGQTTNSLSPFLPFSLSPLLLCRPMLRWAKRHDTENFCRENRVAFCLDPMNEDISFRRVWIRKVLIPMLEEVNPKIVESLCRTAELLQNTGRTDEPHGASSDSNLNVTDQPLSLANLKTLSKTELYSTLRKWLSENRGNLRGLQLKHIEAIERLIYSRKSGNLVEIPGSSIVRKHRGKLVFGDIKVEK